MSSCEDCNKPYTGADGKERCRPRGLPLPWYSVNAENLCREFALITAEEREAKALAPLHTPCCCTKKGAS